MPQLPSFPLADEDGGKRFLGLMMLVAGILGCGVLLAILEWGIRSRTRSSWAEVASGLGVALLALWWNPLLALTGTLYAWTVLVDAMGWARRPWGALMRSMWLAVSAGVSLVFIRYAL